MNVAVSSIQSQFNTISNRVGSLQRKSPTEGEAYLTHRLCVDFATLGTIHSYVGYVAITVGSLTFNLPPS
jgi:hypothetical protein